MHYAFNNSEILAPVAHKVAIRAAEMHVCILV